MLSRPQPCYLRSSAKSNEITFAASPQIRNIKQQQDRILETGLDNSFQPLSALTPRLQQSFPPHGTFPQCSHTGHWVFTWPQTRGFATSAHSLCFLGVLPAFPPSVILLTPFLKDNLKLMGSSHAQRPSSPFLLRIGLPCQPVLLTSWPNSLWLHLVPTPGHSLHTFSLLQDYPQHY